VASENSAPNDENAVSVKRKAHLKTDGRL
jgi:hypothetical protein